MDTVLLVLGILGFGAVVIAAYVFTVAARNYVSESDRAEKSDAARSRNKILTERSLRERRQLVQLEFPVTVNGILIPNDRRILPNRRFAA
jgi:hypothetical protein